MRQLGTKSVVVDIITLTHVRSRQQNQTRRPRTYKNKYIVERLAH